MSIFGKRAPIQQSKVPGVGELETMCEQSRKVSQFCDDLEPMVDLRVPQARLLALALDQATDDDDEPYIWDLVR